MDELLQAARHESFISHGCDWGGTACKTAAASSIFLSDHVYINEHGH
jgi:hypothetical protein